MLNLKLTDFIRFALALIVANVVDIALFEMFGLPLDANVESLAFALGFTILCAIREEQSDDNH